MIIEMLKSPEGGFVPADEMFHPVLQKFKTGEMYEVEVKRTRNPQFHRKVFAFFKFCFDHWSADNTELKFMDEKAQFDEFRKNLTIMAGYFEKVYTIRGELRVRAKSLSFGSMEQDEFEQCYSALINAAIKHIFGNKTDENILNQLYAFFW